MSVLRLLLMCILGGGTCLNAVATPVCAQIVFDVAGRWPQAAEVVELDEQGIRFRGTRELYLPWSEVIVWGALTEHETGCAVYLRDGSRIVSHCPSLDDDRLWIENGKDQWLQTMVWQQVDCTRAAVAGIVFQPAAITADRDRWWDLVSANEQTDKLYLANGDSVLGRLLVWDHQSNPPLVRVQTDVGVLSLPVADVTGVAFRTVRIQERTAHMVLGFRDGSVLNVYRIRRVNGATELDVLGGTVTASDVQLSRSLCYVRSLVAPVRYMTDAEPVGYRHIPFVARTWAYRVHRNVVGERLRSMSGWYDVGLGLHATCRIAYAVPAGATRWEAQVVLDALTAEQASANVRVYVLRGTDFQLAAQTTLLRAGTNAENLRVDVRDCSQIAIIVDAADSWDIGDRVNILVPYFVMR